jgi:pimeloyl-ACP methyl ester carboxylesterase
MSSIDDGDRSSTRSVRAGQVQLSVTERGRGMPILLVHGFPLDHSMWGTQIEFLSRRWRVIAPDLRGFGGSQVAPGTASMEQMADDLNALLDALAIQEPVVLCGLSMGGYIAFQFWRKYSARLRALALCDTRARGDTPEAAQARHKQIETVLGEGTRPLAEAMLPKLLAPATIESQPQLVELVQNSILAASPEGVAAALRGLAARPDVTDYLPRISLPTLVVVGREDAISPVDEMRDMARAIDASEFVVIPHSGHMSPLENPAAFNDAIEQFLTHVERPR